MDFDSPNGFQTAVWGPLLWTVMHMISFNFPVKPTLKQKKEYMTFFESLADVLPCGSCRKSYSNFIYNDPNIKINLGRFKDRETLGKWVFDLHNKVNKKLGYPQKRSFECTRSFYEKFRANCTKDKTGCITPMRGAKKRSIVTIMPRTQCTKMKSVVCKLK